MIFFCILGWLKIKPMTGYELSKEITESVGFFWSIKQSQIYHELNKLESLNLIYSKTVEQKNRPTKKIFYITKEGENYFNTSKDVNDENIDSFLNIKLLYLVRIFFGSFKLVDENISFLKKLKERMLVKISLLEKKRNFILDKNFVDSVNGKIYYLHVLEYGINSFKFSINWIDGLVNDLLKENTKDKNILNN